MVLKYSCVTLFFVYMVLSLLFVKLGGGIPFRLVVLFLMLFVCWLSSCRAVVFELVLKSHYAYYAYSFFAIGVLSGLAQGDDVTVVLMNGFSSTIQPLLIFVAVVLMCEILGLATVVKLVILVYSTTMIVSVLQYFEFVPAWSLMEYFRSAQGIDDKDAFNAEIVMQSIDGRYDDTFRPRGLSWSPIHLSYQCCLLLSMSFACYWYSSGRKKNWFVAVSILCFASVLVSGTRSALLGMILLVSVLFIAYIFRRYRKGRDRWAICISIFFAPFVVVSFLPYLNDVLDLRILQSDDSSASMRIPLYLFGLNVMVDYPFGNSWQRESADVAHLYWDVLYKFKGVESLFSVGLHNYIFNVAWTYGWLGILVIAHFFYSRFNRIPLAIFVLIVPYLFNSMFHNGGIFYGGNYVWVFIGVAEYYVSSEVYQKKGESNE